MSAGDFIVTAWSNGSSTYGIRVQRRDRESFFRQSWTSVSLMLIGGTRSMSAHVNLTPSFWRNCPELRGRVIRDWLFENGLAPWKRGNPPRFRVVPTDEGEFTVAIIN